MPKSRFSYGLFAATAAFFALSSARATVNVYAQDLTGFDAAAGSPALALDFDAIAPGTDITGSTVGGVTFTAPGAPLIVVRGADTFTPGGFNDAPDPSSNKLMPTSGDNVLSPGGPILGPGTDPAVESDGVALDFATPQAAFGFDHLSQSADGYSFTSIWVYDTADNELYAGIVPISNIGNMGGGAPAGADFWGIVSSTANIKRIVISESDPDAQFPDCNIGFDTLRVGKAGNGAIPEPATAALLGCAVFPLLGAVRRRK